MRNCRISIGRFQTTEPTKLNYSIEILSEDRNKIIEVYMTGENLALALTGRGEVKGYIVKHK